MSARYEGVARIPSFVIPKISPGRRKRRVRTKILFQGFDEPNRSLRRKAPNNQAARTSCWGAFVILRIRS